MASSSSASSSSTSSSSASSSSASSPTPIIIKLEYTVFVVERFFIFLLILFLPAPPAIIKMWICFGFIFTNSLSISIYLNSFPYETFTVYDLLFWVERVAFIFLWCSYLEVGELCWNLSIILFSFSNLVHLITGQSFNQKDNPIVSEIEGKKELVELGTQTEGLNSSNDQSHKNGNAKEEKKINEEKDLDIDHADNEETDGVEENGTDSYYEKKLKELNDEWEKKLDAEKRLCKVKINKLIDHLEKFISETNVFIVQVRDMVITLYRLTEEIKLAREEEKRAMLNKTTSNDMLNCSLEKIKILEEEKLTLQKQVDETTQDSLESRRLLQECIEHFTPLLKKHLENRDFLEGKINIMDEEIDHITIELEEMEKLKEELKTQLEDSFEKCSFLEEENKILYSKLQAVTKISEFYKSILRNLDLDI